jgi:hypothetical protein
MNCFSSGQAVYAHLNSGNRGPASFLVNARFSSSGGKCTKRRTAGLLVNTHDLWSGSKYMKRLIRDVALS